MVKEELEKLVLVNLIRNKDNFNPEAEDKEDDLPY